MNKLNKLINQYCPNGVECKNLEQCCQILDNKRRPITRSARESGIYPYYGANGIQDYVSGYIFDGTFVLVGEDGSVMTEHGNPVVNWAEGKIWVNNHAHIITSIDGIMLRYLYHYLQTVNVKPLIHGNIPKLTGGDFKSISIPVPPLPVQEEIVRILDKFTELEAELAQELAQELAHRKQQYAFYRDQLLNFENITSVQLIPLNELAQFTYGYTDVAKESGDTRFIRITDINDDGCLNPGNAKFIMLSDESKKYLLKEGDLLLARTGATYGKTLYVPDNSQSIYASFLIKISLDNSKILNRYYWHFTKSNLYWNQAEKYVSKGGQQQFNANAVGRVLVPVPSIEIQQKLIKVLDNFDTICSDLSIGLPAEIAAREKQYNYYRDLLFNYAADMAGFKQSSRAAEQQSSRAAEQQSSRAAEQQLIAYVFGPRKCA